MSSTTISTLSISLFALSRPSTSRRSPNKPPKNPNPKSNPKQTISHSKLSSSSSSSLTINEATTYSRLPVRDDFLDYEEITLTVPKKPNDGVSSNVANKFNYEEYELPNEDDEDYDDEIVGEFEEFEAELEEEEEKEKEKGVPVLMRHFDTAKMYAKAGNLGNKFSYEEYEFPNEDEEVEEEEEEDYEDEIVGEFEEFEAGLEEGEEKEKGVPAVMRCFDTAKVYAKAGNGGNGVVAFRREKYVPFGGPSGGDGGRGGHVYVEVDGAMNSLLPFRNCCHFRGGRGGHGQGRNMNGAKGEDVVIRVAPGTVVREVREDGSEGDVLLELLYPGQKALLLPGGRGGRGNAAFKTGLNKAPKIAENGEEGPEMWLELELKLVADVGIVGAPNAGKSTLLSVISAAQPNIANYPFTTLLPNLGVVSFDYDASMVVADLPGLLEGAHRGFGLGHEFLRHTERCSVLVHVVDGSSQQPELEFDAIRLELELFNPELSEKPYLVAFNKMDLPEASERWENFEEHLLARGVQPFCMSAITKQGTHEVACAAFQLVQKFRQANKEVDSWAAPINLNHVADKIKKRRAVPINEFRIRHDSSLKTWHVDGDGLQRFVQMTNWRYVDSDRRFQHVLEACGVNKALVNRGIKEGDTVNVAGLELVWYNSPGTSGTSGARKRSTDPIRWPEFK